MMHHYQRSQLAVELVDEHMHVDVDFSAVGRVK